MTRARFYEAGVWEQGRGLVVRSRHSTLALAVDAAKRYARQQDDAPTGGALSWSGGVRMPDGDLFWISQFGESGEWIVRPNDAIIAPQVLTKYWIWAREGI